MLRDTPRLARTLLLLAPLALAGCVSVTSTPRPAPQSTTVVVPPTSTTTGTSTTTTTVCPAGTTAPC